MTQEHLERFRSLVIRYEEDITWREEGLPKETHEYTLNILRECYSVLEAMFSMSNSKGVSVTTGSDGKVVEVKVVERNLIQH